MTRGTVVATWAPSISFGWLRYAPLVVVPALLVGPMFAAGLGPIDDHELPALLRLGQADLAGTIAAAWDEGNRFRPLWWVFRITEVVAWNGSVAGMYLDRFALLVLSLAAAYAIAVRYVGVGLAVLASVLVVAGPQAEAWYRLGPQEAWALPLLLGGVAMVLRGKAIGLVLLVLAGLTKESFVAFAFLGTLLAVGRTRPVYVGMAGSILAVVGVYVAVLTLAGRDQYGLHRDVPTILTTAAWAVLATPAMWLAPLALRSRWAIVGALVWLGSVVVYAGQDEGRYLLPGALVGVVGTVYTIRQRPRLVPIAAAVIAVAVGLQLIQASLTAQRTRDWQADIAAIRSALGEAELVVQPTNFEADLERAVALQHYVNAPAATLVGLDGWLPPARWARYAGYGTTVTRPTCLVVTITDGQAQITGSECTTSGPAGR